LAYPIQKENYAFFGFTHFEGDPAAIGDLKNDLKLNPQVLRYLIITPPFVKKSAWKKSGPSKSQLEETRPVPPPAEEPILTNEALEKKIEEILK
jgi:ribosomal protein S6